MSTGSGARSPGSTPKATKSTSSKRRPKPPAEYDLIVVGAGPAGTTLAGLVKKHNPAAKVLIVEKAEFPRHHVGESLLPGLIPVLKELGVYEKINAAGFPKKIGVVFVWGKDRKPWDADFGNLNEEMLRKYGRVLDSEFSWQVLRSKYDEILLRHAESLGVEARLGVRAVEPVEEDGVIKGLVLETPEGRQTLRCRLLADCSGQNGFLSKFRGRRRYREDLKNVAAYAYYRGAKWKYEYAGHPDKTKIFVCSAPEGWFWYIPLSADLVSVGLVAKAGYVKSRGVKDMREHFFKSLKACREIAPLLKKAELVSGIAPAEPAKDFFTAGDWSFENETVCGPGWLAAGDSAFFIDPLLSSGVMMAHLCGHRAAYTATTAWREKDAKMKEALWKDYGRFCREIGGSFLDLVRYWYHHDPNAKSWWKKAKTSLSAGTPLDLSDKMSFVAIAAGINYYFERSYTSQTLAFTSGTEHSWQWEGTKHELKSWARQILTIVETGFMKKAALKDRKVGAAKKKVALSDIPASWVPRWRFRGEKSLTFLPQSSAGLLFPIHRVDFPRAKRVLPLSYLAILDLIDGRRSASQIMVKFSAESALPQDIVEGQVFRLLKDLSVMGAVEFKKNGTACAPAAATEFRRGEAALRRGEVAAAETALSCAIGDGADGAWARALRGEARRHLGRRGEALKDLEKAVSLLAAGGGSRSLAAFDAAIERSWVEDRVLILRGKLRQESGDFAGAQDDAEAALKINPRQSEGLLLRAKARVALGDLEPAREDLKAALAIETSGKKGQG